MLARYANAVTNEQLQFLHDNFPADDDDMKGTAIYKAKLAVFGNLTILRVDAVQSLANESIGQWKSFLLRRCRHSEYLAVTHPEHVKWQRFVSWGM